MLTCLDEPSARNSSCEALLAHLGDQERAHASSSPQKAKLQAVAGLGLEMAKGFQGLRVRGPAPCASQLLCRLPKSGRAGSPGGNRSLQPHEEGCTKAV